MSGRINSTGTHELGEGGSNNVGRFIGFKGSEDALVTLSGTLQIFISPHNGRRAEQKQSWCKPGAFSFSASAST